MNKAELTAKVLELIKAAQQKPVDEAVLKAWTQPANATTGIASYDLEAPAKMLFPVLTPIRNRTPRVSGKGGIQANWRAITGINVNMLSPGVGQGNRGGVIASTTKDYTAAYKGIGLEDYVTFEAEYSAEGFQDIKATAVDNLLKGTMISEEKVMLGGNTGLPLGLTPTPTVAGVASGGALADATYSLICVALNAEATWFMGGFNNGFTGTQMAPLIDLTTALVPQLITRINADGSQDTYGGGAARKSGNATAAVSGGGGAGSFTGSVTAVRGAFAYAWFFGSAGTEKLAAITYINSVKLTALPNAGNQTAASLSAAVDYSTNGLIFDGLLTFASDPAGGAYYKAMATGGAGVGTPLTADGDGGCVEVDSALQAFWDLYRLSPTRMYVATQEQRNLTKCALMGKSNGAERVVIQAQPGNLIGGRKAVSYLNKYTMAGAQEIPIELHPNMIPGTIMFETDELPYPLSNVINVKQIRYRRDYYQTEWPLRSRKYEYGVYADEVLQHFFPPSLGIITNIADGIA